MPTGAGVEIRRLGVGNVWYKRCTNESECRDDRAQRVYIYHTHTMTWPLPRIQLANPLLSEDGAVSRKDLFRTNPICNLIQIEESDRRRLLDGEERADLCLSLWLAKEL